MSYKQRFILSVSKDGIEQTRRTLFAASEDEAVDRYMGEVERQFVKDVDRAVVKIIVTHQAPPSMYSLTKVDGRLHYRRGEG